MTSTIPEIQELMEKRYTYLIKTVQSLSDEQLNTQIHDDKRSIAEILKHLMRVDGLPTFGKKLFYNTINIFTGVINKSNKKPVDASDYEWRSKKDKPRKSKYIPKEKLEKSCQDTLEKLRRNLEKAKNKDRRVFHITERHANAHMRQIQILCNKISS